MKIKFTEDFQLKLGRETKEILFLRLANSLEQGWTNSNRESAIFRYFGCISLVFCCIVAQKVNFFGKFPKLKPTHQIWVGHPWFSFLKFLHRN
jgi:hypothetical protein